MPSTLRRLPGKVYRAAIKRPGAAIANTFQRFISTESASGVLLLAAAVLALVWANSAWHSSYFHLWEVPFTLQIGTLQLTKSIHHWINDGLMAVFFLLVGLEIKREVVLGELSSVRQAMLPIMTALGGMVVPALIYMAFNAGTPASSGWGIPMATDIAFALGVLMLMGRGVPLALKVMLTALAIVDDLGAVLVIAVFYTSELDLVQLGIAGGVLAVLVVLNLVNNRMTALYLLLGAVMWVAMLKSGVHATVAGVLLALTIPVRSKYDKKDFIRCTQEGLEAFRKAQGRRDRILLNDEEESALYFIERTAHGAQPPLQRLEHSLRNFVAFVIMPVFALANAGVDLSTIALSDLANHISLGIILGLFLGKQVGIMLFAWLAIRFKWAVLPAGATWKMVYGLSVLAGIGFTMSLFIAELAFTERLLVEEAKLGILLGTLLSGVVGVIVLRAAMRSVPPNQTAVPSADAVLKPADPVAAQ